MRLAPLVATCLLSCPPAFAGTSQVFVSNIDGTIGPATASYVARSIQVAQSQKGQCLIVRLNTPGGLLDSTQSIVRSFLAAQIPVIVYVAPMGATAASAGCFITLASDIAAMAPATTIGAAHPVALGGGSGAGDKPDETMAKKLENFAASYIQTLASRRNRNVQWAESSVRESASISAEKARELRVIDLIASDQSDLLNQLDGRTSHGMTLHTKGAPVTEISLSPAEQVFQTLWRPEVMFILTLVAIYGLIGEFTTPGAILPGVVGVIALVLVLYMSAILPVNVAGLLLILLSVGLFVIDLFAPTHGVLTGGGIVAFLVGSLMLFNRQDPLFRLSLAYIIPGVLTTALFFLLVVSQGVRAQRLPIKVGPETMVGTFGRALTAVDESGGKVLIGGEYWNAISAEPIGKEQAIRVTAVQGLTVSVKPESANTP
jgi:membrane-bound serine protease (ClpP class)